MIETMIDLVHMTHTCVKCGDDFDRYIKPRDLKRGRGKFCSRECFHSYHRDTFVGENHWSWKETLTYGSLHDWLGRKFGSASKCEGSECKGVSIVYQWALIKGKEYEKKRENFMMLCRACHYKYDGANIGGFYKGKHLPQEMKDKISAALKGNSNARKR